MTDIKEIDKIARLSRIKVQDDEKAGLAEQISSIMEMINQIHEVDCTDIEPLRSVVGTTQHLRKDQVVDGNIAKDLFTNAPGKQANLAKDIHCYVVPKVVE